MRPDTDVIYKTDKLLEDFKAAILPATSAYKSNPDSASQTMMPPVVEIGHITRKEPTKGYVVEPAEGFIADSELSEYVIVVRLPRDCSRDLLADALNKKYGSSLSKEDFGFVKLGEQNRSIMLTKDAKIIFTKEADDTLLQGLRTKIEGDDAPVMTTTLPLEKFIKIRAEQKGQAQGGGHEKAEEAEQLIPKDRVIKGEVVRDEKPWGTPEERQKIRIHTRGEFTEFGGYTVIDPAASERQKQNTVDATDYKVASSEADTPQTSHFGSQEAIIGEVLRSKKVPTQGQQVSEPEVTGQGPEIPKQVKGPQ